MALEVTSELPPALLDSLKQTFGFDQFRQGQGQTIAQLIAGQSSLAIFPTGSGKSLCYQFTALHLPHVTLVVSPLLALIKDQLEFLASKGIPAASIDSTLSGDQSQQVMADVRSGKIKILMVSVERFKNERFRQFINAVPISMLVVDEAHCISEWGHNFRPDYLKLPTYCQELNIPLVLLLTATATKKVKNDMASKFAIAPKHIVQTGFYRSNLDLTVIPVKESEKIQNLLQQIKYQQQVFNLPSTSGIVYVTLQHTAEKVAAYLHAAGVKAVAYHAGFDSEKRQQIQNDFMQGRVDVVVATIAFGMGIDKSDIRFVMHYDLPKSIENYSQEIGRAGRDGHPSNCVTFANLDGLNTVENFVYGDTPEYSAIEFLLENIRHESKPSERENNVSEWELQVVGLSNASNIRQLPLKTLLVQLEMMGVIKPMYAYFAEFKYKFLQDKDSILSMFEGERREFLRAVFSTSQFKKVWGAPNFDELFKQYNTERSRVITALDYLAEKQLIELESKKMTEVFRVNQEALHSPELAKSLHYYFVDKEEKEIKRIASLVRFFELDQCLSANLARYFDDQQAPQRCGHCSVCRGQVAKLEYSEHVQWPSDEYLKSCLEGLSQQLSGKADVSIDIQCRFLAGISVPVFARNKVRQLAGFACCEQLRYGDIRQKLIGFRSV
ncbi:MAG: recombinase RecQ [Oleispira sp.]|nr:recombinase RecQ [Oleispira sp.]|tara:strand:- start:1168 stop:3171 length:2004 start_codon:yes stop_codon:yes gene_type:complete